MQLQLRKPDRLSRYHEKSSILRQEPEKAAQAKRTPHSALGAHLEVVRGFSASPLLPLKHFATRRSLSDSDSFGMSHSSAYSDMNWSSLICFHPQPNRRWATAITNYSNRF